MRPWRPPAVGRACPCSAATTRGPADSSTSGQTVPGPARSAAWSGRRPARRVWRAWSRPRAGMARSRRRARRRSSARLAGWPGSGRWRGRARRAAPDGGAPRRRQRAVGVLVGLAGQCTDQPATLRRGQSGVGGLGDHSVTEQRDLLGPVAWAAGRAGGCCGHGASFGAVRADRGRAASNLAPTPCPGWARGGPRQPPAGEQHAKLPAAPPA